MEYNNNSLSTTSTTSTTSITSTTSTSSSSTTATTSKKKLYKNKSKNSKKKSTKTINKSTPSSQLNNEIRNNQNNLNIQSISTTNLEVSSSVIIEDTIGKKLYNVLNSNIIINDIYNEANILKYVSEIPFSNDYGGFPGEIVLETFNNIKVWIDTRQLSYESRKSKEDVESAKKKE